MQYNNIIDNFLDQHGDPETERFVEMSLDFIDEIHEILKVKNLSQKDLASKMDKSPAEVSKWLSGSHNITFKSLAKLSVALDEEIVMTTNKAKMKYAGKDTEVVFVTVVHKDEPQQNAYWNYTFLNKESIILTESKKSNSKNMAHYGC